MQRFDRETRDSLYDEVILGVQSLEHPDCTIDVAGRFYEEVTDALRAVAILSLLLNADVKAFRENLALSGRLREDYMKQCRRADYMDLYGSCSRADSLFDALAAGDMETARRIGALSPA